MCGEVFVLEQCSIVLYKDGIAQAGGRLEIGPNNILAIIFTFNISIFYPVSHNT